MNAIVVAVLAGGGACLALPSPGLGRAAGAARAAAARTATTPGSDAGWMLRRRWLLSAFAGVACLLFVGGVWGATLAPVGGVGCWLVIGRIEPPAVRREREQAVRDLPHLVQLLGAALASGAAPTAALEAVTEAVPGPASAGLATAVARLRLGADPAEAWSQLARSPTLAPLGRALARAHSSGAPVAVAIERLAEELARVARSDVETRARAVGVKAAVPLGLCLLPCFLLIGIVPLAAGLLGSLRW